MSRRALPSRDPFPLLREGAREGTVRVTVRGASMLPALADGTVVEVAAARRYLPGDVVAFRAPDGRLLVHRVLGYRLAAGLVEIVTRGDACPRADAPVPVASVIGRVALRTGPVARCRALLAFSRLALSRLGARAFARLGAALRPARR